MHHSKHFELPLLLLAVVLVSLTGAAPGEKKFFNYVHLAGKLHEDHVLFDGQVRSRLDCMLQCCKDECCVGASYSPSKSCRSYWSDSAATAGGFSTYINPKRVNSGPPLNVAVGMPATQSSVYYEVNFKASLAVDGNLDTDSNGMSCSHTDERELPGVHWWQVNLGTQRCVESVVITNRGDCCSERLHDFDIHVYKVDPVTNPDAAGQLCAHHSGPMGSGVTDNFSCSQPISGRFVRITNGPDQALCLCEVAVMARPLN